MRLQKYFATAAFKIIGDRKSKILKGKCIFKREELNYRPASLTNILCSAVKVIRLRIIEHWERESFVTKGQHEFRWGMSCLTNFIEFYDEVTNIQEKEDK